MPLGFSRMYRASMAIRMNAAAPPYGIIGQHDADALSPPRLHGALSTRVMIAPLPFRLVCDEPSPRFLGLAAAERNRRVAHRARPPWATQASADAGVGTLPTLRIPPGVIITPALVAGLPAP